MAAKRYDPPKPRMSIRRVRSIKNVSKGGAAAGANGAAKAELPRATSVVAMAEDDAMTVQGAEMGSFNGPPIGLPSTGGLSGYPPHEMRYLTYKHARWSLRVRKEVRFVERL